jgi:hypothetical protein
MFLVNISFMFGEFPRKDLRELDIGLGKEHLAYSGILEFQARLLFL